MDIIETIEIEAGIDVVSFLEMFDISREHAEQIYQGLQGIEDVTEFSDELKRALAEIEDTYSEEERDSFDELKNIMTEIVDSRTKAAKSRVYVGDESEVPAAYTPQYGLHGGIYYETGDQESQSMGDRAQATVDDFFGGAGDMAEDIVDALMDFIPLDRDRTDHLTEEDRQRMQEVADRAAQRQFDLLENSFTSVILNELSKRDLSQDEFVGAIMELNKAVTGFVGGIKKSRTYVSSPEEVPEGYEVQEGGRGGYYYETDSGGGMSAEGLDDMSENELEEFRDYLMDQHQAAREARQGRGGRGTDTMEDELMRDIMDVVMDVDTELMDRDGI